MKLRYPKAYSRESAGGVGEMKMIHFEGTVNEVIVIQI